MLALVERNALVARRVWLVVLSGFAEPVMYLIAIQFGLGAVIGPVALPGGRTLSYAAFVAPALLAASAMNGALYDSTVNFFWKLRYQRYYEIVLVTPLSVREIALGEITWAQVRGFFYSAAFLTFIAVTGAVASPWALLALPAAMLTGFAFGAAGVAASSFMRSWQDLELITVAQLAMFLFSTTFFPLSAYPEGVRTLIQITPLCQADELIRSLCLGEISAAALGHVAYLGAMTLAGLAVSARRIRRLLCV